MNSLLDKIPKLTRKESVRAQKRNRKYRSKNRKWAKKILKQGHFLVCGTSSLCLDCNTEYYGSRLCCGKCFPSNVLKGLIYGVHQVTKVGDGIRKAVAHESRFLSSNDLYERLKAGQRFFEVSGREEITLMMFVDNAG